MAMRWTLLDEGMRVDDENPSSVIHTREGPDGAAAALTLTEGECLKSTRALPKSHHMRVS